MTGIKNDRTQDDNIKSDRTENDSTENNGTENDSTGRKDSESLCHSCYCQQTKKEQSHPIKKQITDSNNISLIDFLFEAGMLRHTPRSGYAFLGSGKESVAEHSFRVAIIGHSLAIKLNAKALHTMQLCLYHDFHEARTADLNYVNKIYCKVDAEKAMQDALKDPDLEEHILPLWQELLDNITLEARITHDADQLDLLLNLKREKDLNNPYAEEWAKCCIERLQLNYAKELANEIMQRDHSAWWFESQDRAWWEKKK